MIRNRMLPLPEGVAVALVAEGNDIILLADPDALLPLDLEQRYTLYNEVFRSVDAHPASRRGEVQPVVARVLDLDLERLRRAG